VFHLVCEPGGALVSITAATLFSGIGAPEVAMPHWNWAWHAEIEKFPSAVMAARHPGSINLGDVSADGFAEKAGGIAKPDVLIFGSPCQSYSIAGKRLGLDDPRGNLALTALRIVARLKPRWFLFENVPGLFSSWSGEEEGPLQAGAEWDSEESSDFVAFLSLVDELGYSGAWSVLDAQYRGVAQRRDRVFFAGHSGDWRASAAVLLEPEGLCGNHPPRRQAGQDVAGTLSARPSAGGGLGTDFDLAVGLTAFGGNNTSGPIEVATALNAHGGPNGRCDFESETFITHALRAEGFDASEDGTGRGTPIIAYALGSHSGAADGDQTNRSHAAGGPVGSGISEGLSHSLRAGRTQSVAYAIQERAVSENPDAGPDGAGFRDDGAAYTLEARGTPQAVAYDMRGRDGGSQFEGPHDTANLRAGSGGSSRSYVAESAVRRLTPMECERLQGFPDRYSLIDYRGKPAADGPRYKALGNSMAVPVIRWILSRIEIFERDVRPLIERAA
jgi:DNA (cytosine-5)-methyltransferase 1